MASAAMTAHPWSHGSWTHAVVAALPTTTRARRALHRACSFGSLLAFMLIDFSRYFFDQCDRPSCSAEAIASTLATSVRSGISGK